MLATQLAQLGVDARIVDKMPHPVLRGHADGIHARTSEVLEAMGVYAAVRDEGLFWKEGHVWDCSGDAPRVTQRVDYVRPTREAVLTAGHKRVLPPPVWNAGASCDRAQLPGRDEQACVSRTVAR